MQASKHALLHPAGVAAICHLPVKRCSPMHTMACCVPQLEVACEELRAAARALGRVTGAIDTEAVLDSIFTEFCIGK